PALELSYFFIGVFGRLQHALALAPFQARSKQGPFPPARCLARLLRYYEPLGLPPGSVRFPPSGLICPVFVRLDCQVGSLLFRVLLWKRATAPYPGKVQHSIRFSRMLSVAFALT